MYANRYQDRLNSANSDETFRQRSRKMFTDLEMESPKPVAALLPAIFGGIIGSERRAIFLKELTPFQKLSRRVLPHIRINTEINYTSQWELNSEDRLEEYLSIKNELVQVIGLIWAARNKWSELLKNQSRIVSLAGFRTFSPDRSLKVLQLLVISRQQVSLLNRIRMISFAVPLTRKSWKKLFKYTKLFRQLFRNQINAEKTAKQKEYIALNRLNLFHLFQPLSQVCLKKVGTIQSKKYMVYHQIKWELSKTDDEDEFGILMKEPAEKKWRMLPLPVTFPPDYIHDDGNRPELLQVFIDREDQIFIRVRIHKKSTTGCYLFSYEHGHGRWLNWCPNSEAIKWGDPPMDFYIINETEQVTELWNEPIMISPFLSRKQKNKLLEPMLKQNKINRAYEDEGPQGGYF